MKSSRSDRNACTATSLAAFSTQGAVPPASAASRASAQARERVEVGRLELERADRGEVERAARARRRGRDGAARRRSARACPGGRGARASRRRRGATSACTIDCGCTTTSIRSYGVPNSQCASITSRPLFISVAESIVILPPIAQVGCRSAARRVTSRELGAAAAAERAARRGQREALDGPGPLALDQLVQRGVLGVDRDQLRAGGLAERHHELTADDERLLVGERDVDALGERDDRRPQAGRADDRVEHEVGAGLGDEPHEALGPREHLAVGPGLAGARRGVAVAQRDPADAVRARLRDSASCERSADSPTSSNASGERATTSSAWVPIEPVEPRIRSRFIRRPSVAGAPSGTAKRGAARYGPDDSPRRPRTSGRTNQSPTITAATAPV